MNFESSRKKKLLKKKNLCLKKMKNWLQYVFLQEIKMILIQIINKL